MANDDHDVDEPAEQRPDDQYTSCFRNWMFQQQEDLEQLMQAINQDIEKLRLVIQTSVKHFDEYLENRKAVYAQGNTSSFFSPTWCSSFEKSYLWVGGCRPSLLIQLLYTLSGSSIETHLDEFLAGARKGNLGEISADQLHRVDALHRRTIQSEDQLSSKIASMQEQMGDKKLVEMALTFDHHQVDQQSAGSDVHAVLDSLELPWIGMLEKADELRLNTMKEMINILTPLQAVEYLIAGKKLHLSIHQWCSTRNH
ncbi:Tga transcription factor [Thalictrum thalictroides]|uniref:Tga transcription factor n=1 Tax=Thalictrum thalictroides TaxID=46969 RepID=A0A7J6V775_THATH|nr:Tga transcription factor [Thalictrum thalictroides]